MANNAQSSYDNKKKIAAAQSRKEDEFTAVLAQENQGHNCKAHSKVKVIEPAAKLTKKSSWMTQHCHKKEIPT
ncbi:E3 ubiquitin-protein ligase UPL1-like protein [Corchorus olitorius]|uniref:E3 ubiquitin-protein ligase UPL1-like protein n=1 Tax=Corchorus olitorius TaxID=93759 RepID=A0A1R3IMU1_9ROSI|nr:E3 ubiquitin-protein ligase UPL1-like protein [Corchorus olitorius]